MQDIVILGPTCSWKSSVAIDIAEHIDGEIISCDSMQVYKGLEIGTAQPTAEDLARIPHHLIGCFPITKQYDVNIFLQLANDILNDIHAKGKTAIIVGGTGLYARSLVYGHTLLPADSNIQQRIKSRLESPEGEMEVKQAIINAAGGIDAVPKDILQNPRHLLRAAEILEITGILPWQMRTDSNVPKDNFNQFIIMPELNMLKERIAKRTSLMLEQGWINETQAAIGNGLMQTPTARQALGYREIAEFLSDQANGSLESLNTSLCSKTIHYARRQLTWFRHQHPGANFIQIEASQQDPAKYISGEILRTVER